MSSSSKRRKKKDLVSSSSNPASSNNDKQQHIRFDGHEKDEHDEKKASSSTTTTTNEDVPFSKSQKRKKKRKRSSASAASATTTSSSVDINLKNNQDKIFNGLILALSTDNKVHQSSTTDNQSTNSCNINDNDGHDQYETLKSLKTILIGAGATISPQVHKRVHYLICTQSAIDNLTQRIRQAIKRNVDIVSVDWVKKCIQDNRRVDVTSYVCNEVAREIMVEKEREKKASSVKHTEGYDSDIPQDDNGGWSEPVQLDCCCVCHENGDDNCPWCTDCNINLAKKKQKIHVHS